MQDGNGIETKNLLKEDTISLSNGLNSMDCRMMLRNCMIQKKIGKFIHTKMKTEKPLLIMS